VNTACADQKQALGGQESGISFFHVRAEERGTKKNSRSNSARPAIATLFPLFVFAYEKKRDALDLQESPDRLSERGRRGVGLGWGGERRGVSGR
jgi:hypothetical protein